MARGGNEPRRRRGPRGAHQSRATLLGACESLALRISAGFGEAVTAEVEGHRLEIGLSIGAALVDPNVVSVESAMRRSHLAMYRAKQARHGRVAIIDTSDGETDLDTYALYGDLMQAVRDDALAVEFQPVEDGKGVIHSVEALQALGIQRFQGCFFSLPKSAAALLEELAIRPSTMDTPS